MRSLIESGVDIDSKDDLGFTALMVAALEAHSDVVEYLIARGADLSSRNNYGATALHKVLDANLSTTPLGEGRRLIALSLIANGAPVNASGFNETTALHVAAFRGDIRVIEALLRAGADSLGVMRDQSIRLLQASRSRCQLS